MFSLIAKQTSYTLYSVSKQMNINSSGFTGLIYTDIAHIYSTCLLHIKPFYLSNTRINAINNTMLGIKYHIKDSICLMVKLLENYINYVNITPHITTSNTTYKISIRLHGDSVFSKYLGKRQWYSYNLLIKSCKFSATCRRFL